MILISARVLLTAAIIAPLTAAGAVGCARHEKRTTERTEPAYPGIEWRLRPPFGKPSSVRPRLEPGPRFRGSRPPTAARVGDVWVNPKDGAELVFVPAGEFLMGLSSSDVEELLKKHPQIDRSELASARPQRRVLLDAYWIYKHEVTLAQYRKFCQETGRKPPSSSVSVELLDYGWVLSDEDPVLSVSWYEARAYARWAGMSLPTEAQWEKAARGTDGRLYPWGDEWPPPKIVGNFSDETYRIVTKAIVHTYYYDDGYAYTAPVGTFPAGASPYGCLDMAGNVWEWCADRYAEAPSRNPRGPASGRRRCARGGSWHNIEPEVLLCARRGFMRPTSRSVHLGFRCVWTPR